MKRIIKRDEFLRDWTNFIWDKRAKHQQLISAKTGSNIRLYSSAIYLSGISTYLTWGTKGDFSKLSMGVQDKVLACINIICDLEWEFEA